jgi:MoxR-like ATPase
MYKQSGKSTLAAFAPNEKMDAPSGYRPSPALVDAVNVAIALGQPLLLTGEPGTGKTQLAYHVADCFGLGEPLVFNAQTSSSASDLFYRYDALGHFQYNQNNPAPLTRAELEQRFIQYNALGQAIRSEQRAVVLIDEIDKAPRDLPNDILFAIERLRFRVPELPRDGQGRVVEYEADKANRPIIILTSNSEKSLPDAFLRRVVYFHIEFPAEAELREILKLRTGLDSPAAVRFFLGLRGLRLKKAPATAEMLAWALWLSAQNFPLERLGSPLTEAERSTLHGSYVVLAKNNDDLDALKKYQHPST